MKRKSKLTHASSVDNLCKKNIRLKNIKPNLKAEIKPLTRRSSSKVDKIKIEFKQKKSNKTKKRFTVSNRQFLSSDIIKKGNNLSKMLEINEKSSNTYFNNLYSPKKNQNFNLSKFSDLVETASRNSRNFQIKNLRHKVKLSVLDTRYKIQKDILARNQSDISYINDPISIHNEDNWKHNISHRSNGKKKSGFSDILEKVKQRQEDLQKINKLKQCSLTFQTYINARKIKIPVDSEYFTDILKNVKNSYSDFPAGRQEAVNMMNCFKAQDLEVESMNFGDRLELSKIALYEIARQVFLKCSEQGMVLVEGIRFTHRIVERVTQELEKIEKSKKKFIKKQKNLIREEFKAQLDRSNRRVLRLIEQRNDLQDEIKEFKCQSNEFKHVKTRLNFSADYFKIAAKKYKDKFTHLKASYNKLHFFLQNKLNIKDSELLNKLSIMDGGVLNSLKRNNEDDFESESSVEVEDSIDIEKADAEINKLLGENAEEELEKLNAEDAMLFEENQICHIEVQTDPKDTDTIGMATNLALGDIRYDPMFETLEDLEYCLEFIKLKKSMDKTDYLMKMRGDVTDKLDLIDVIDYKAEDDHSKYQEELNIGFDDVAEKFFNEEEGVEENIEVGEGVEENIEVEKGAVSKVGIKIVKGETTELEEIEEVDESKLEKREEELNSENEKKLDTSLILEGELIQEKENLENKIESFHETPQEPKEEDLKKIKFIQKMKSCRSDVIESLARPSCKIMVDSLLTEYYKLRLLQKDLDALKKELEDKNSKLSQTTADLVQKAEEIIEKDLKIKELEGYIESARNLNLEDINPSEGLNRSQTFNIETVNQKNRRMSFSSRKSMKNLIKRNQKKLRSLQKSNAVSLIENLVTSKLKRIKHTMNLKMILKSISIVYTEMVDRIKRDKRKNIKTKIDNFSQFLYDLYAHRFGFKKIAEKNFSFFILSLKFHSSNIRVNIFCRFLGLIKSKNYTVDETLKFFQGLHHLSTSKKGVGFKNKDNRCSLFPFIRAEEFIKNEFEGKLSDQGYTEIKKSLEKMRMKDKLKTGNFSGLIDADPFLEFVIEKYRIVVNRTKQFVIDAFKSCDLDGNNTCSVSEYMLLNRYIEADRFDVSFIIEEFFENCDTVDDGEDCMSFDRFAIVCLEKNLFSEKKQNKFLEINSGNEIENKFKTTKSLWDFEIKMLRSKMEAFKSLTDEEREDWEEILSILNQRMLEENQKEKKSTLIAFFITKKEFDRISDEDEREYIEYNLNLFGQSKEPEENSNDE